MQRSISTNQSLAPALYLVLFVIYSSLSSIYPLLPPLFALIFVLFSGAMDREETLSMLVASLCLVVYEANFGYILFSSIIYFYLIKKLLIPKIEQSFSCVACIKISYVLLAYIGYFLFLTLFSNIFLLSTPEINYYIIYYIVIEFLLVSLL